MLVLELPYPPSSNHYYNSKVIRGKVIKYISKEGQQFIDKVKTIVKPHLSDKGVLFREGLKLAVYVDGHMPDKRKRDLDNLLKATQDSLQFAKVIVDDFDIDQVDVNRCSVKRGGMLRISIAVHGSRDHIQLAQERVDQLTNQFKGVKHDI